MAYKGIIWTDVSKNFIESYDVQPEQTAPLITDTDTNSVSNKCDCLSTNRVIALLIFITAIYIAWTCNANEHIVMRLIYTFFSGMFGIFYLIYYFIFYVLFKVGKCS